MELNNFKEFYDHVSKFGFSLNNFYDVEFSFEGNPELNTILAEETGFNDQTKKLIKLYTDECSLPGLQISTGEYRITNSPQLRYAYGSVFSETNFSFLMDSNSTIRKIFDVWTNYIYGYSISQANQFNSAENHRFRTRYRDEYVIDIKVIKYENVHSEILREKIPKFNILGLSSEELQDHYFPANKIIPVKSGTSQFYRPVPVYSMRLINAFPINIASVPLNSGASALNRLSVSFDYESITSNILTGSGSIDGQVMDPVNG